MDIGSFGVWLSKGFDFLKSTNISGFGITVSLFDVLIGGILIFLIFYFIFRSGE